MCSSTHLGYPIITTWNWKIPKSICQGFHKIGRHGAKL